MHQPELEYWLAWNRVPGVGSARFTKLLHEFGSMKRAWHGRTEELIPLLGNKTVAAWTKLKRGWDGEKELDQIAERGYQVFCLVDAEYPANLKAIPDPPPVLYCWGSLEYRDAVAVALVGTRNPTPMGAYHAEELGQQLSRQGLTIVSGMARGIDSFAHRGALEAGGRTIAVLGCGLDVVYPRENRDLMEQIARHGAVVTEFPLGTPPLAANFPARNRIISGLSLGVVVVEATRDSGSLITADFALEQGREVFAVPGSIENEGSKGPHQLIQQGAKLVEDYQDILAELAIPQLAAAELSTVAANGAPTDLSPLEVQVYSVLTREPVHINLIQRKTTLAAAEVNFVLTQLELKGIAKRFPGQLYLRIK